MAILINGTDSMTRTTNLPSSTAFTMCAWGRRQADQNNYSTFIQFMNSGGTIGGFLGYLSNGDDFGISNYSADATILTAPGTGNWVFGAITNSGTGAGACVGYAALATSASLSTGSLTGPSFTAGRFDIGADQFGENQFNGNLACVKIWGAVLTQAELEAERWSCWPVRWANLNSFYPMFTASDDTIDYSGNASTFTKTGTTTVADHPPVIIHPFHYRNGWQGAFTAAGAPAAGRYNYFNLLGVR